MEFSLPLIPSVLGYVEVLKLIIKKNSLECIPWPHSSTRASISFSEKSFSKCGIPTQSAKFVLDSDTFVSPEPGLSSLLLTCL